MPPNVLFVMTDQQRFDTVAASGGAEALLGRRLRAFPFQPRPRTRIYQFDGSRGIRGFPARPEDVYPR
jgi:arylsulfatase A-like enzyme